jgi:hypothetical protein
MSEFLRPSTEEENELNIQIGREISILESELEKIQYLDEKVIFLTKKRDDLQREIKDKNDRNLDILRVLKNDNERKIELEINRRRQQIIEEAREKYDTILYNNRKTLENKQKERKEILLFINEKLKKVELELKNLKEEQQRILSERERALANKRLGTFVVNPRLNPIEELEDATEEGEEKARLDREVSKASAAFEEQRPSSLFTRGVINFSSFQKKPPKIDVSTLDEERGEEFGGGKRNRNRRIKRNTKKDNKKIVKKYKKKTLKSKKNQKNAHKNRYSTSKKSRK